MSIHRCPVKKMTYGLSLYVTQGSRLPLDATRGSLSTNDRKDQSLLFYNFYYKIRQHKE